jgi:hypothetical protein
LDRFSDFVTVLQEHPELGKALGQLGHRHWQNCFSWPVVIQGWGELIRTGHLYRTFDTPTAIRDENEALVKRVSAIVDHSPSEQIQKTTAIYGKAS